MSDDANDLGLHVELGEIDVLPDRILALEIRRREIVVDVDHDGRVFVVLVGYESTAK